KRRYSREWRKRERDRIGGKTSSNGTSLARSALLRLLPSKGAVSVSRLAKLASQRRDPIALNTDGRRHSHDVVRKKLKRFADRLPNEIEQELRPHRKGFAETWIRWTLSPGTSLDPM